MGPAFGTTPSEECHRKGLLEYRYATFAIERRLKLAVNSGRIYDLKRIKRLPLHDTFFQYIRSKDVGEVVGRLAQS